MHVFPYTFWLQRGKNPPIPILYGVLKTDVVGGVCTPMFPFSGIVNFTVHIDFTVIK
jgi:hypothetical protein